MPERAYSADQEHQIVEKYLAGASGKALIREYGGSTGSFRSLLRRNDIDPRSASPSAWRALSAEVVAEMAELWRSGLMQHEIAERFRVTQRDVSRALGGHGYRLDDRRRGRRLDRHPRWKGGRVINGAGYRMVKLPPDHPLYCMALSQDYVPEHRLTMAEATGRPLMPTESVHHINGDKLDNRLENLQLRQAANHGKGIVMSCLDCGSHNVRPIPMR